MWTLPDLLIVTVWVFRCAVYDEIEKSGRELAEYGIGSTERGGAGPNAGCRRCSTRWRRPCSVSALGLTLANVQGKETVVAAKQRRGRAPESVVRRSGVRGWRVVAVAVFVVEGGCECYAAAVFAGVETGGE